MKTSTYDAVIVGGGLNSLVAAAYLARAGKSVLVAEQQETLGGAAATVEFAPGVHAWATFGAAELLHPCVAAELELAKAGLELLPARGGTYVPSKGGSLVIENGAPEAIRRGIAAHSAADADAFATFEAFLRRVSKALDPVWTRPLPDLKPSGIGDVLELLTMGWRLRGLGKTDMPEALRYLPMPIRDVLDERFETDVVKSAIAAAGLSASWLAPRSAGSALLLLLHRPGWVSGLLAPPVFVRGGLGRLSAAVAETARSRGAEIRTGCRVERILIDDEGRACGVAWSSPAGDSEVAARVVVSGLDPRRTLLELADPSWLDPEWVIAVRKVRTRGTVALVHLALGGLPAFDGAPDGDAHLAGRIRIGATLDEIERSFDGVKYGELPERPSLEITVPSLSDPGLAPDGKHVMHVWAQYVPHAPANGSWDERRDELGDLVVGRIAEHAPGFAELVEHRTVVTPLDLERRLGCTGGCLYHVEPALDQMLFMRPMPGSYQYRTPIDRLYMCGPGTHPGVSFSGLCGKNAAAQIVEDWGKH